LSEGNTLLALRIKGTTIATRLLAREALGNARLIVILPFQDACFAAVDIDVRPIVNGTGAKQQVSFGGWLAGKGSLVPQVAFLIGEFRALAVPVAGYRKCG
jgi:hypothetical protein